MKWLIILIALICLVMPASAVGTVIWTNQQGETITSAYIGDSVRFSFDTVDNGSTSYDTVFYTQIWHANPQTGVWIFDSVPGFNLQMYGGNSTQVIAPGSSISFNATRWQGWGNITMGSYAQYKAILYGYNSTRVPTIIERTNATITVSNNPLKFTNFGDWAESVGGDGLRYFLAIIIIVVMIILPFAIMKVFNLYIEILMIVFGLGISFAIGLLDPWVLLALGIGALAIYMLVSRSQGANQ